MRVDTDEPEIIERVAALDVGKAEVVCCVRVPGPSGQRMQEVRTVSTMTAALLELGDWLAELGVTRVVMEATGDYWRAPFYLLEGRFETWLVNAHDVKHLPGRPKTDRLDAVWLCKVAERQILRPSFVPPPHIRALRGAARAAPPGRGQRVRHRAHPALHHGGAAGRRTTDPGRRRAHRRAPGTGRADRAGAARGERDRAPT